MLLGSHMPDFSCCLPAAERGELAESVAAPPPLAAASPASLSCSDSVDGGPGSRPAALNNAVEGPPLQQQGARRRGAAGKRGSPQ